MNYLLVVVLFISLFFSNRITAQQLNIETVVASDTTVVYSIDDVSAEGASATVLYRNGNIVEAAINVYGETGQERLIYRFSKDWIEVAEKQYAYSSTLVDVKTEADIELKKELSYVIDRNGKLVKGNSEGSIAIFDEFKKIAPFVLRD